MIKCFWLNVVSLQVITWVKKTLTTAMEWKGIILWDEKKFWSLVPSYNRYKNSSISTICPKYIHTYFFLKFYKKFYEKSKTYSKPSFFNLIFYQFSINKHSRSLPSFLHRHSCCCSSAFRQNSYNLSTNRNLAKFAPGLLKNGYTFTTFHETLDQTQIIKILQTL